jgi:hypothetical protein
MGGFLGGTAGRIFDPLDILGFQADEESKKADKKLEKQIAQEKADEAAASKATASATNVDPLAEADADLFKRNALQGKTTKISSQLGVL